MTKEKELLQDKLELINSDLFKQVLSDIYSFKDDPALSDPDKRIRTRTLKEFHGVKDLYKSKLKTL